RQYVGAPGTVPLYLEIARKRQDVLARYRSGEQPPQIELGCYYDSVALRNKLSEKPTWRGEEPNCTSGYRSIVRSSLLADIQQYQFFALDAMFRNGLYASAEMQDLLTDLLHTSDQLGRPAPYVFMYDRFAFADNLLSKLLAYEPRNSAERVRRAHILVTAADIDVLRAQQRHKFRNFDTVLEQYRQAYAALQSEGVGQAELDAVFSPQVPVMLPAYNPSPLRSQQEPGAEDYIDVTFTLTQRGTARNVDVTGLAEGVKRSVQRALLRRIAQGGFRPRMVDGAFPEFVPMSMRFYVGAASTDITERCMARRSTGGCKEWE
ncbi:MAG: hypothetical protein ACTS5G_02810, partial [Burkholderiales bacterium]